MLDQDDVTIEDPFKLWHVSFAIQFYFACFMYTCLADL